MEEEDKLRAEENPAPDGQAAEQAASPAPPPTAEGDAMEQIAFIRGVLDAQKEAIVALNSRLEVGEKLFDEITKRFAEQDFKDFAARNGGKFDDELVRIYQLDYGEGEDPVRRLFNQMPEVKAAVEAGGGTFDEGQYVDTAIDAYKSLRLAKLQEALAVSGGDAEQTVAEAAQTTEAANGGGSREAEQDAANLMAELEQLDKEGKVKRVGA